MPDIATGICACFFPPVAWVQHVARRGLWRFAGFLSDARHRFVPDDLSCADRVVRTDLMGGANQVTDHYLVALARQHGITLATLDKPLARAFGSEIGLVELVR